MLLATEGLVIHKHNQGASVRVFSAADIEDLYRIRRVLEVEGVRQVPQATSQQLFRISREMEQIRAAATGGLLNPALAAADVAFHASIIALIGSPGINQFYEQSGTLTEYAIVQLQQHDASQETDVDYTVIEHQAIHDAIIRRDVFEAQRLILEHIARHETNFLSALNSA